MKDMIEKLFPDQSLERRQQVENWQKEAQELGDGARDADLEALMAQISHLLEDANSGAEMNEDGELHQQGSTAGTDHRALRPTMATEDQPQPSTSLQDGNRNWTRLVRPRSSLLVNVTFTMGAFRRRRRRFRPSSSQGSGVMTNTTTSGISGAASAAASGGVSWNTQQSYGGVSNSLDEPQGLGSQASGAGTLACSQQSPRRGLSMVDEQERQSARSG